MASRSVSVVAILDLVLILDPDPGLDAHSFIHYHR